MEIAFIDHYDSFSFNVIDWLKGSSDNVTIKHVYYDDAAAMLALLHSPMPLVLSPGPKAPEDAPQTLEIINSFLEKAPILGICLGHQMLCKVAGASVVRCADPVHGEVKDTAILDHEGIFRGLPLVAKFASYNSLCIDPNTLPANIKILAKTAANEIQAVQVTTASNNPVIGLQFHPESFLSEFSKEIAENWLKGSSVPNYDRSDLSTPTLYWMELTL